MPAPPDVVVEIPAPETVPGKRPGWWLLVMALALVLASAVFVTATAPRRPPLDWAEATGPQGSVNLDSLVATTDGFAMLSGVTSEGVRLLTSSDGVTWDATGLSDSPSQLAPAAEGGVIAYGPGGGRIFNREDDTWTAGEELVFPDEIRSRQGSGRPALVDAGDGLVAMSILGDVWWSRDGSDFQVAISEPEWGPGAQVEVPFDSGCRPPVVTAPDVPPMVRTGQGLVALVSSNPDEPFGIWPVCEPVVWTSDDGRSWARTETVIGDEAYVYSLAWREGRFVAVGGRGIGQPQVWTSTDGDRWEPIDTFSDLEDVDLYSVQAGPAGWVILGRDGAGAGTVGWSSPDGLCWLSLPWQINGADAAVGTRHILVVDSTTYPDVWVGEVTGGSGSC